MSDDKTYILPAPDAPAEDWGRLAVSLPGWRWMPGMLGRLGAGRLRVTLCGAGQLSGLRIGGQVVWSDDGVWPDPDDPATAGCLLALLGPCVVMATGPDGSRVGVDSVRGFGAGVQSKVFGDLQDTLGRACIAAAEALRRWPGGEG